MRPVYLERMFRPRSVAVVGANNRPRRVGHVIMRNLLAGGFDGPIMPVNPRYDAVAGVLTYPDVASLPRTPDLAILCTPPHTVPELVDELGARGTRAVVVIARALGELPGAEGRTLQEQTLRIARQHGVRILGGGTLGILAPHIGLNASFARVTALPGNIGFVSQSDAVGTLLLDWAHPRRVGFSHFISLGDAADVGFGEALDYLGSDPETRAILLYIESLRERGSFMAAARGAARNKPVLVIKAGRARPARRPPRRAALGGHALPRRARRRLRRGAPPRRPRARPRHRRAVRRGGDAGALAPALRRAPRGGEQRRRRRPHRRGRAPLRGAPGRRPLARARGAAPARPAARLERPEPDRRARRRAGRPLRRRPRHPPRRRRVRRGPRDPHPEHAREQHRDRPRAHRAPRRSSPGRCSRPSGEARRWRPRASCWWRRASRSSTRPATRRARSARW